MTTEGRLKALITWGQAIGAITDELESDQADPESPAKRMLIQARQQNPWFTEENIIGALNGIVFQLKEENLRKWLREYHLGENHPPRRIGVIMAGNIPAVGFQDALCVLVSGNYLVMKNASDDKVILPFLLSVLSSIEPAFADKYESVERLRDFDAVIATGSNNSARYFEYYFKDYPHIIRGNRNSIAVLSGKESAEDLYALGKDIFSFFGLGCRNVSHLYVPEGYSFNALFESFEQFGDLMQHARYMNNYDYHNALYLLNNEKFLTNNFLILRESPILSTPVSVLHYSYYSDLNSLEQTIQSLSDQIQCRVGLGGLPFGTTQCPAPWEYADNVDVLRFLEKLNVN